MKRRLNKVDAKIKEIQQIQRTMERRTLMEAEAEKLTAQCRFDEANTVLNSIPEFQC